MKSTGCSAAKVEEHHEEHVPEGRNRQDDRERVGDLALGCCGGGEDAQEVVAVDPPREAASAPIGRRSRMAEEGQKAMQTIFKTSW